MNAHDAAANLLREKYHELTELDRRVEGIRYSAALLDGTPVVVLAVARDLEARIRSPERFLEALERASAIRHETLARPLAWGREVPAGGETQGVLHCAYARLDVQPIAPGSLLPADVATIGMQLARGLAAAHGAGMVHGAITTERIAPTRQQGVVLGDFGLFAAVCAGGVGVREAASILSETPYVSPEEQVGSEPDERSDVYSLGASLYELLTGKPPYGGRTTAYVMASVLSDVDDALAEVAPDRRSGPVVDALLRAIEHAPDDRWPTMSAFANALAAGAAMSRSVESAAPRNRGCLPEAVGAAVLAFASLLVVLVTH